MLRKINFADVKYKLFITIVDIQIQTVKFFVEAKECTNENLNIFLPYPVSTNRSPIRRNDSTVGKPGARHRLAAVRKAWYPAHSYTCDYIHACL